ncbi:hypothetical protein KM540_gp165 [Western grey kangaroopox virus]|uniref:Uncharacterized protein n=1 Tax=Western grey kangaroopox virus TaxID=1566307 RepID=A0A2C9DSE9_9POXV|nr:hypothetical protein KM540_gp001 [Western grey kangaroopox virus]YP_010085286.1 hypothetical protein KM540_gp165 [Western grey kangaroopox virus]ATI20932.1 hypothetical protein [Western grey kangaroopox virus]ATI21096.1 hypothetical protein [Western grey kangaroopox virus]
MPPRREKTFPPRGRERKLDASRGGRKLDASRGENFSFRPYRKLDASPGEGEKMSMPPGEGENCSLQKTRCLPGERKVFLPPPGENSMPPGREKNVDASRGGRKLVFLPGEEMFSLDRKRSSSRGRKCFPWTENGLPPFPGEKTGPWGEKKSSSLGGENFSLQKTRFLLGGRKLVLRGEKKLVPSPGVRGPGLPDGLHRPRRLLRASPE